MSSPSSTRFRRHTLLLLGALAAFTALICSARAVNPAPAGAWTIECIEIHCGDGDGGIDEGGSSDDEGGSCGIEDSCDGGSCDTWDNATDTCLPSEVIEIHDPPPADRGDTGSGELPFLGGLGSEGRGCGGATGYLCLPPECNSDAAKAQMATGDWSCMDPTVLLPLAPPGDGVRNCPLDPNPQRCTTLYSPDELATCQDAQDVLVKAAPRIRALGTLARTRGWPRDILKAKLKDLRAEVAEHRTALMKHNCLRLLGDGPAT
jgi:hypothetical protein